LKHNRRYIHLIISSVLLFPLGIWLENNDGLDTLHSFSEYLFDWFIILFASVIFSATGYGFLLVLKKRPDFVKCYFRTSYFLSFIILCLFLLNSFTRNEKVNPQGVNESSFNGINKSDRAIEEVEHLDTIRNIYSNFIFAVSVDLPDHWVVDQGISRHTILRCYDQDSAITFSINVIPNDTRGISNIWDILDSDELDYRNLIMNELNKQFQIEIEHFMIRKSFLQNYRAIRNYFERDENNGEFKITYSTIQYQILKKNRIYTFSLTLPTLFYNDSPEYYESYFDKVMFLREE